LLRAEVYGGCSGGVLSLSIGVNP